MVRLEWGLTGLQALAAKCRLIVVIDVLRFTTLVDVLVARGGTVTPLPQAAPRDGGLSPTAALRLGAAPRHRCFSPNGGLASLKAAALGLDVYAGCLRNAAAVAAGLPREAAVGIVPAGERWPDGSLRFALEDWLGAGAVCARLAGELSPEAAAAAAAFEGAQNGLQAALTACPSGQELVERGLEADVELASQLDVSTTVPRLVAGSFGGTDVP